MDLKYNEWCKSRTSHTLRGFGKGKLISADWCRIVTSDLIDINEFNHDLVFNYLKDYHVLLQKVINVELPTINRCGEDIKFRMNVIDTRLGELNVLLEFILPDGECALQWMLWPEHIDIPCIKGTYHDIYPVGKPVTQPRQTVCYGYSYNFSGQTHESEEPTDSIKQLMDKLNVMANLPETSGVNMCLSNHYSNGFKKIGEHSDDEKSMGYLKDVYCFCEGSTRELILRYRKNKKAGTPTEREVIRINMPSGLYVMYGGTFQQTYTHEFPELYPSLYKKIQKILFENKNTYPTFPRDQVLSDKGAPRLHLLQSDWIQEHQLEVTTILQSL